MIQLNAKDVGNFTKIEELVAEAKLYGAQMVIFPEDSVFGWLNPDVFLKADVIPGKYSNEFARISKRYSIWILVALGEKGPDGGSGALPGAHQAYDSNILIDSSGEIVMHHRQFNIVKNSFTPEECKRILNQEQCSYTPGTLSDITTVKTPFGKTSILVCSDAFTYDPAEALNKVKLLNPDLLLVSWGITAGNKSECGTTGFNAAENASITAKFLKSPFVIGANGTGDRVYGKYLPSVYCGWSGYSDPSGNITSVTRPEQEIQIFTINKAFMAEAGPIWNENDAKIKCPTLCNSYHSTWTSFWKTTIPNQMSVCECMK